MDDNREDQSQVKNVRRPSLSWKRMKYYFIPIEMVVFLFMFATYCHIGVFQQYNLVQHARNVLHLDSRDSGCLNQSDIELRSNESTFKDIQTFVNRINQIATYFSLVLSIIVLPILGPFTDRYGRKPLIYFVFGGTIISYIVDLVIVHFNLSMYLFVVSSAIGGLTGGFSSIFLASLSYAADITSKRWLTVRNSTVIVALFVSLSASSSVVNQWLASNGCQFEGLTWFLLGLSILGLLYTIILPESLSKEKRVVVSLKSKRGLWSLFQGAKIFLWIPHLGASTVLKLWMSLIVICIAVINETGGVQISYYFFTNEPLQWDRTVYGNYMTMVSSISCVILVFVLPVFVALKFPDPLSALIGVVATCAFNISLGFAQPTWPTWAIFIGGALMSLQSIVSPVMRSYMIKLVGPNEKGAAYSFFEIAELLSTIVATALVNNIYQPDTESESNKAGRVFWIMGGLWVAAILILFALVLHWVNQLRQSSFKHVEEEAEKLLNTAASLVQ